MYKCRLTRCVALILVAFYDVNLHWIKCRANTTVLVFCSVKFHWIEGSANKTVRGLRRKRVTGSFSAVLNWSAAKLQHFIFNQAEILSRGNFMLSQKRHSLAKLVSKLVFYAQSTGAVISGRSSAKTTTQKRRCNPK